jgi:hypothetical protein
VSRVRLTAAAAALFGFITLCVLLAFGMQAGVEDAYGNARAMSAALSQFQRVETLADLGFVFGGADTAPARAAAMHAVNRLDLWAFIPAYTLFLIAAALLLAGEARGPLAWAAIGFAVLGAGADAVETSLQLAITADLANAGAHLPIAPWHWLKYGALALNGFCVAGLCLLRAPKRWILGVAALLPLPAVLAAYAGLVEPRLFSAAFAIYWVALIVVALIMAVRGKA